MSRLICRCRSISTHSLTRRLTGFGLTEICGHGNFNSQPHKEADSHGSGRDHTQDISTHSLTRRLTESEKIRASREVISTHSLTRRLTAISDKNIFIQN